MQDCMNRQGMELASASTSTAVPAAKRRGPVAALIAAFIVAAALLFAMPSLAYASEAEASPQQSEAQEILLSKPDSSTSVNKTPDEPNTPPAYTQQDAFTSTPQSTGSGVDGVSGGSDSNDVSYTPGDDKSSNNDKDSDSDSDSASDSSTNGTEDEDDSTANDGEDTSDNKNDTDSTDDSNGASSGSTDEIATDTNQSAHPTGSDSKADDVIATPGDKESADQNAGTTSVNIEEVQGPRIPANYYATPSSSNSSSSGITTADTGGTLNVTFHFNDGWNTTPTGASATPFTPDKVFGSADDPIFANSGKYLGKAGSTMTMTASEAVTLGLDKKTSTTVYNQRYGYTFTSWIFVCYLITAPTAGVNAGKHYVKLTQSTCANLANFTNYKNLKYSSIDAYPILAPAPTTITFYNGETGLAYTDTAISGTRNYDAVLNIPPFTGDNNQWLAENGVIASNPPQGYHAYYGRYDPWRCHEYYL